MTHIGSTQDYWYDQNGNQTTRLVGTDTFTLLYDAENRLVEAKKNNATIYKFVYDGDGKRVKSEKYEGATLLETILFVGAGYEVTNPGTGQTVTKYYFAGSARIAMRKYVIAESITLTYLFGDHLGSTSLAVDASTGGVVETRYKPWGEVRYTTPLGAGL